MEWRSPSNWEEEQSSQQHTQPLRHLDTLHDASITAMDCPQPATDGTTAPQPADTTTTTAAAGAFAFPSQPVCRLHATTVTTGEAMDLVAAQCERRGLTSAATWLSELSLHALPSVLALPLSPSSSLVQLAQMTEGEGGGTAGQGTSAATDAYASQHQQYQHHDDLHDQCHTTHGGSPSAACVAQRQHFQRLHRVALGYVLRGEFQRCHQIILREVMRGAGVAAPTDDTAMEGVVSEAQTRADDGTPARDAVDGLAAASMRLPAPEVVRGFRTTTLPPLLQFLCLYALFMDGAKAKQLSNSAAGAGPQRAVHPHARVLRAYLLEALRNPINALPGVPACTCAASGSAASFSGSRGDGGSSTSTTTTAAATAKASALAECWDPHTPQGARQPWTITSASRGMRGATAAATTAAPTTAAASVGMVSGGTAAGTAQRGSTAEASRSSVGSHAFSNYSPAAAAAAAATAATRHPMHSPAVTTPAAAGAGAGSSDLLRLDPYLTWLMGVVLRELRMRQECATYLLAAVTVNPLLRSAWEDLSCLVSREAQLAELDAALESVEPHFMTEIFAAEVRGLLGVTPVASARLRRAAAAAAVKSAPGSGDGSAPPLSPASPHVLNGARGATDGTAAAATVAAASAVVEGGRLYAGGQSGTKAPPTPPPSTTTATNLHSGAAPTAAASSNAAAPSSAAVVAAAPTNAWEALLVLFPDAPSLMGQLAHFLYHQRNQLDKAEALYRRIRAIDPHYYAILYDYSNVLYTKRDRLGLSSLVQSVYQADAYRAETNFAVGNYYVLLGQHDRAALHFQRTTAIDPQCAEAWLLLGHAYVEVKNTTAAVEAYRTAVSLNERDYRGWYNLGQIYELLEAYHHALYYYWHTTSLRPADPGMWVAVANCLEHDGRVAESIACLERAESYDVNTSPNYPAYVRRIATHHIANSSFTRACVYLEKLVQSPAATGEDLLLALPFLVQHYVQRARRSMETSARSASFDPALFASPGGGLRLSPSSPSTAGAGVAAAGGGGRAALNHARAAAALQHLNKAEEHLQAMSELVLPAGTTMPRPLSPPTATAGGSENEGEGGPGVGSENRSDGQQLAGATRQRAKPSQRGSAAGSVLDGTGVSAAAELPSVGFVRTRHSEIASLRAQVMQLLQPPTSLQQQPPQQYRGMFSAHPLGRH